ncbi:hypothetical protein C5167_035348 [Papaver somniferum]|uniref:Phytocyanin domain-containing protein n=1 Tax=Papaver somniferum TaxID=3469 RepID=A0A4Y7KK10_PAPSO|nr:lamin-like protein [Papaver somniferum]RZC72215.1 hypothetical protein C5167_035348 [Papaver somniferum]
MEMSRFGLVLACSVLMVVMMMPCEVEAKRWTVGGNKGWTSNVNYTIWAQDIQFYKDDWLFFVYDRNQQNVLQVNRTDYESCNENNPIHSWTTGAGRDVVPLNVTKHYYFISGHGFCYGGMKLAVHVINPPPPPRASPIKSDSAPSASFGLRSAMAFVAAWTFASQLF